MADEFVQDAWLLASGTAQLVLETPADRFWARAVRQYGRVNAMYRFFPDDPSYN